MVGVLMGGWVGLGGRGGGHTCWVGQARTVGCAWRVGTEGKAQASGASSHGSNTVGAAQAQHSAAHRRRHVVAADAARLARVGGQARVQQIRCGLVRRRARRQPLPHKVHNLLAAGVAGGREVCLSARWRVQEELHTAASANHLAVHSSAQHSTAKRDAACTALRGASGSRQQCTLAHHIPDAVAGQHQKGVVGREARRRDVGLGGDDLVLGLELLLLVVVLMLVVRGRRGGSRGVSI